ncbi:hypothetical protein MUA01_06270 [Enterobacteriaceae bacterium H18W14]|uniref:hypothetical protein n=1 Tax=Dryocola boscaweniae TaxID=2925397 RepID=UPI0022F03F2A|nr:hypothetical protein [Dryocola boscaweniae]MCT4714588.1 hypothetical protein [Dryocola boscaweniae]
MRTILDIRASILEAMTAGTDEPDDLNKSAEDALAEAVQSYLNASTATASKSAPKAKTIKEKGIALCHQAQGYSANLRPVSLMMKASLDELTPEQRAALERLGYVINQGV